MEGKEHVNWWQCHSIGCRWLQVNELNPLGTYCTWYKYCRNNAHTKEHGRAIGEHHEPRSKRVEKVKECPLGNFK